MTKKNLCVTLSFILFPLSILSSFVTESLNLIVGIAMLILSVAILIVSTNYSKEYNNNYGTKPNGSGLITFGATFNVVCGLLFRAFNSIGTLFILIGAIIVLLNKNNN